MFFLLKSDFFNRSLVDTINDKLFYFERESVKPLLWTKILFESDVKNDEVYSILNNLIDPRMIFLDKELSYDEIKNCIVIFKFLNSNFSKDLIKLIYCLFYVLT